MGKDGRPGCQSWRGSWRIYQSSLPIVWVEIPESGKGKNCDLLMTPLGLDPGFPATRVITYSGHLLSTLHETRILFQLLRALLCGPRSCLALEVPRLLLCVGLARRTRLPSPAFWGERCLWVPQAVQLGQGWGASAGGLQPDPREGEGIEGTAV